MARVSWEYLAGFTDGDGCIHIRPLAYEGRPSQMKISWYQHEKDAVVLTEIAKFLKLHGVNVRIYDKPNNGTKIQSTGATITMAVSGKAGTKTVLENIEPFLIIKQDKAREALKILNSDKYPKGHPPRWNKKCKKGLHDITNPENVYWHRGKRACRPCRLISSKGVV